MSIIKKIIFKKLANMWLKEKKKYVKISTYATYQLIVFNYLIPYFGEFKAISSNNIQNFVNEKYNIGFSQKFIKDIMIVLNMIFEFGNKSRLFNKVHIDYILSRKIE